MIVDRDEKRFGKYNGGYAWFSGLEYTDVWWDACSIARYYEQSALEDVAKYAVETGGPGALYEFPKTNNYGWWRMFQSDKDYATIQKGWGIRRLPANAGITVNGESLLSVHTHWVTQDYTTSAFNTFVRQLLEKIAPRHVPAKRLLAVLCQS